VVGHTSFMSCNYILNIVAQRAHNHCHSFTTLSVTRLLSSDAYHSVRYHYFYSYLLVLILVWECVFTMDVFWKRSV